MAGPSAIPASIRIIGGRDLGFGEKEVTDYPKNYNSANQGGKEGNIHNTPLKNRTGFENAAVQCRALLLDLILQL